VGVQAQEDDGEPFEEKMQRLTGRLGRAVSGICKLKAEIRANLMGLGYEI
jgi:type I restriction enzyme M protein